MMKKTKLIGAGLLAMLLMVGGLNAAVLYENDVDPPVLADGVFKYRNTAEFAATGLVGLPGNSMGVWNPPDGKFDANANDPNVLFFTHKTGVQARDVATWDDDTVTVTLVYGSRADSAGSDGGTFRVHLLSGGYGLSNIVHTFDVLPTLTNDGSWNTAELDFAMDAADPGIGSSLSIWVVFNQATDPVTGALLESGKQGAVTFLQLED